MARTESNMLALGTKAPDLEFLDTLRAAKVYLKDIPGKQEKDVMLTCDHCT